LLFVQDRGRGVHALVAHLLRIKSEKEYANVLSILRWPSVGGLALCGALRQERGERGQGSAVSVKVTVDGVSNVRCFAAGASLVAHGRAALPGRARVRLTVRRAWRQGCHGAARARRAGAGGCWPTCWAARSRVCAPLRARPPRRCWPRPRCCRRQTRAVRARGLHAGRGARPWCRLLFCKLCTILQPFCSSQANSHFRLYSMPWQ